MTAIYAALVGAAVALLLRVFWEVPESVRQHDRRVRELSEDLETWVVDDDSVLRGELLVIDNEHSVGGSFSSSFRITARNRARAQALLRYRNEHRRVLRSRNELEASEGLVHAAFRWIARRRFPAVDAFARVEPALDRWRTDDDGNVGTFPDPTKLALDDLLSTSPSRNPWY